VEDTEEQITIGRPIDNAVILILDPRNNLCAVGVDGEICIGGHCLAQGYFRNESLTRQKFFHHPLLNMKLYRTGDIGHWTNDGELLYKGRSDNQVKIAGHRIELDEVASALRKISGVVQAAALVKELDDGQHISGYYSSTETYSPRQIREELLKYLPPYAIPADLIGVDNIPLTSNGKLDTNSLHKLTPITTGNDTTGLPSGEDEPVIFNIWTLILKSKNFDVNDNFFEVGGNSRLLILLHEKLNAAFPGKINIADLFSYNTIKKQAGMIKSVKPVEPVIKEIEF
jgi:hypothetical protein